MCGRHLWNIAGPCCEEEFPSLCERFPRVDWRRQTWKLKQPAAIWAEARQAHEAYPGSPTVTDPDGGIWAYNGSVPQYEGEPELEDNPIVIGDVYAGNGHWYEMRAGEFLAQHSGGCSWSVQCRERLCVNAFTLMKIEKPGLLWYVTRHGIVGAAADFSGDWSEIAVVEQNGGPNNGSIYHTAEGQIYQYISWRLVLQAAECSFLPAIRERGLPLVNDGSIEGGLLYRLEEAAALFAGGAGAVGAARRSQVLSYYRPTALDIAVSWTLSGGISFGFVPESSRSPLAGQLVIFEGARYAREERASLTVVSVEGSGFGVITFSFTPASSLPFPPSVDVSVDYTGTETPEELAAALAVAIEGTPIAGLEVSVQVNGAELAITSLATFVYRGGYFMSAEAVGDLVISFGAVSEVWVVSSPWELVSGPELVAELGVVNRFERNDGAHYLPAWIELELVRI